MILVTGGFPALIMPEYFPGIDRYVALLIIRIGSNSGMQCWCVRQESIQPMMTIIAVNFLML